MKKYMIVYSFTLSSGKKCTVASFADNEKEADTTAKLVNLAYEENPEVYIYTIYGYQLLYR